MSTERGHDRPGASWCGRYVRTFLNRHASLMPTFAAFVIFIVLLVGARDPLRQLPDPAQHVGAAARQRLPADPGRRA